MKQKVLYILLLLFACAWNTQAWGQTYNGGTWYSLYDDDEKTNVVTNTDFRKSDVFAPTNNTISFDYKRYTKISTKANLYVHQSEDGNDFSQANGSVYIDNTSYSNSNGSITIKSNICKIKFRSSSTGYSLKNIKIPLAKHILLNDGSTYGTTSMNVGEQFEATPMGTQCAKTYTINLRSFLTNGNITITSDNSAFHFGNGNTTKTFNVGANACASANGNGNCGTGTLGKIDNYAITVYFTPSISGTNYGTITISDGTSPATVTISGQGKPVFNFTATTGVNITEGGSATATVTNSSITGNVGQADASTTATFTATANSGYEFVGWGTSANATFFVSIENPYQPTVTNNKPGSTQDITLYAIFKELPIFYFKASAISSPSAGGSATAQIANGTASANASYTEQAPTLATESITKEVSFSATPNTNEGYDFSGWAESAEGEIISKENPYTINITSSAKSEPATPQKTLYARFSKKLTPHVNTEVSEMKVGDVVVPAFSFTNTDNPTFVITHTPEEAGVAVISYDQSTNTLSALNAGTAKIKFTQAETSTINSGTDEFTITVSKNTAILTSLLPATMTVDDEITNIYSLTENDNTNPVTISSSNENVLRYDTESKKLVACGGGTATITIAQDANYKWNSISTSVDIAVNKLTPSFTLNTEGAIYYVGQKRKDFLTLDEGDETLFTYSSTNPSVADVKDGYLELYSEGSATITVTHQTSSRWSEVSKSFSVSPQTTANHVPIQVDGSNYQSFLSSTNGNIYWQDNGIRMTENGFNWDDKYVIIACNGIPDKLSFSYKLGNGGATGISFYVEESDNGTSFTNVWSVSNASTSYTNVSDLQLKPTTRFVKLCYSGNFGGFFSNINITELKYFKSDKTELNFGTNDEGASVTPQSFTFSFCNAGIPTNISIDDTNFSVSLSQVPNTGRDKMGTQEISVTYLNTTPGEHTGTLTIADEEGNKQTVSLKGTTNITTLNLYPDQALSYTAGKTYPTVILNRTLKQGYNTLALPFDTGVATLTGRNNSNDWVAQLALVTKNDQDGYTLYFTKVEDGTITANQPYIIYLGDEVVNPSWTNMTVVAAESESFSTEKNKGWTMKSNYEPKFSMNGKYGIVNSDGNIQKGASSSTLNAFSAYLEGPANSQVKAAFLDDATAIEEILQQADEDTVIKRIENGKLVILQGDKKYNASGVRLK